MTDAAEITITLTRRDVYALDRAIVKEHNALWRRAMRKGSKVRPSEAAVQMAELARLKAKLVAALGEEVTS